MTDDWLAFVFADWFGVRGEKPIDNRGVAAALSCRFPTLWQPSA
jgi:hypothetical protein